MEALRRWRRLQADRGKGARVRSSRLYERRCYSVYSEKGGEHEEGGEHKDGRDREKVQKVEINRT